MHLKQGGLAGAVRAEQGDDLALVHVEVDAEEDLHRAVGRVEAADGEERLGGHDSAPAITLVSSSAPVGGPSSSSTRLSATRLGTRRS